MIITFCILSIIVCATVQSNPVNNVQVKENHVLPTTENPTGSDFVRVGGSQSVHNQLSDLKTEELYYPGYGGYPAYGKPYWAYSHGWYGWRPHYGIHGGYWGTPGFWIGRYYG